MWYSFTEFVTETSLNIYLFIDMMSSNSFLVKPSILNQVNLWYSCFLKQEFIIRSSYFIHSQCQMLSSLGNIWLRKCRCPYQNCSTLNALLLHLPSFTLISPWQKCSRSYCYVHMAWDIYSYKASIYSSGRAEVGV